MLREIDAARVPEQLVFTKTDTVDDETVKHLLASHPGAIAVSARTGDGVAELSVVIGDRLRAMEQVLELRVPYDRGDLVARVHRDGEVLEERHEESGTRLSARVDGALAATLEEFSVPVG